MFQSQYFIDKLTISSADTLLAHGVAPLLETLQRRADREGSIRIHDMGSVFAITLEEPLQPGDEKIDWFCPLPFIETKSRRAPEDWYGLVVVYDEARQQRAEYLGALQKLSPEARRAGANHPERQALPPAPRSDWDTLAGINQMGAIPAYSQALEIWHSTKLCFPDLISLCLRLFATTPNDLNAATEAWKKLCQAYNLPKQTTLTPVQVLNPTMGKGINRVKMDGAHRLGNPDSFWLLEFLKFWGLFRAAIPKIVRSAQSGGGRGPNDRKTYVLLPANLTLDTHAEVFNAFRKTMWTTTAVKMDILAALHYTATFLKQWLAGKFTEQRGSIQPDDHVNGLAVAYYKDLGNAVALLNLAEINLPRWMTVTTEEEGSRYLKLLEEHRHIVASLDESRGNEYHLLVNYRDFLSGQSLDAFFRFTGAYAALTASRLEQRKPAPRFSTDHLEVLLMALDSSIDNVGSNRTTNSSDRKLLPILQTPGFQNIARAIRQSTVRPQYYKAQQIPHPYDVRYGLGAELLRYANYPERFIQALSDFVFTFNQENSQVYERYKGNLPVSARRASVKTDDLTDIVTLIDRYGGSAVVANLLVAFGYARQPYEPGQPERDDVAATDSGDLELAGDDNE